MKKLNYLVILFLVVITISPVLSVPPSTVVTSQNQNIQIVHSPIENLKQNSNFSMRWWAFNSTVGIILTNSSTYCTINILEPTGKNVWINGNASWNASKIEGNKLACQNCFYQEIGGGNFTKGGLYGINLRCQANDNSIGGDIMTTIEVTPLGYSQTAVFYFIILILSLGFIVLGYWTQDPWIIIMGSFGLILCGLFVLFYGINDIKDTTYTWGLGIITLMLGVYFMVRSSMETLN